MIVNASFFGTDGIRGKTSTVVVNEEDAIALMEDERTLTPSFMRVLGEALSHAQPALPGEGQTVVVGWDRRPDNLALVEALTLGLRLTGSTVIHVGECATPTLHLAVLAFGARIGCMITASHNPVTDSGIKVFDAYGYKSTPEFEIEVSRTLRQLASEDREVDATDRQNLTQPDEMHYDWAQKAHVAWLSKRWTMFEDKLGGFQSTMATGMLANPFLLDCSGGFGTAWLSDFLESHGLPCQEIGAANSVLNSHRGAGDFSPTQRWTHAEAAASPHALLKRLKPAPAGQWVAAALDGDGDRCLLIEATDDGFRVVDGDAMAALLVCASGAQPWSFAASIESDVALMGYVQSHNPSTTTQETAVGDRWLAYALRPVHRGLLKSETMPLVLGIEDSGHIVLPAPHPTEAKAWSLVGDGAATLCAVLMAADQGRRVPFQRGWKRRVSVNPSRRERWHAQSEVFDAITSTVMERFEELGMVPRTRKVEGEPHLLLVHAEGNHGVASVGVRNSGTEAKTNLSLRLSPNMNAAPFEVLLKDINTVLEATLGEG
jgi:phosphoglucosamine mutase